MIRQNPVGHMTNTLDNKPDNLVDPQRSVTNWPTKVDLIGVQVSEVDYESAVESICQAATKGERGIVSCHAVHAIVTMSCDERLREMVNEFRMITPDGQPVRWAMNWLNGSKLKDRVYGPELMLQLCRRAERERLPIYLYGGNEQVAEALPKSLNRLFPSLIIAGSESPPFRPLSKDEDECVVERINASGARIVFIGLGCPKQDIFAYGHRQQINGIQVCVGAAFDFHAGAKPMAPQWMQRNGLEWMFRLCKEPGRLWKRYLQTNTIFVWKVATSFFATKNRG